MADNSILARFSTIVGERLQPLSPKQSFMLAQAVLAVVFIGSFGLWRLSNGQYGQAAFDLCLSAILMITALLGTRQRYFRIVSLIFCVIYTVAVWMVVLFIGELGLLWAFPVAVAVYFSVRAKDAIVVTLITYLFCMAMLYDKIAPVVLATFSACYAMVTFFAYSFSNRLLNDNYRLQSEATIDSLTGASNRRAFDDDLADLISGYSEGGGEYCMLMIDVDDFKAVNDHFGHGVGDVCLQRITQHLQRLLKGTGHLYRYGGEEFVVVVKAPLEQAHVVAERLRAGIAGQQLVREIDRPVTLSIGVTCLLPEDSGRRLMMRVDSALYRAKSGGKNRVVVLP